VNRKVNKTIEFFYHREKIPQFGQRVGGNKGVFKLSRKGPDLPGTGKNPDINFQDPMKLR
jgi:hypothetical protein